MFAAMLRNEITWFDADENASVSFATRLALDLQNVRVVAVVPQEPFLFAASIHENMAIFLVHGEFRHFRHSILIECYF
jgi:ABC-type multidrug transport system fused ATPase/permease subunit